MCVWNMFSLEDEDWVVVCVVMIDVCESGIVFDGCLNDMCCNLLFRDFLFVGGFVFKLRFC